LKRGQTVTEGWTYEARDGPRKRGMGLEKGDRPWLRGRPP